MPGSLCAVYDCSNCTMKNLSKSFFKFPKAQELCKQWLIKLERADLDEIFKKQGSEKLNRTYLICSDHFIEEDYNNPKNKSQGLKKNSVPSLNLPSDSFKTNKRGSIRENSMVGSDYETTLNEIIPQDLPLTKEEKNIKQKEQIPNNMCNGTQKRRRKQLLVPSEDKLKGDDIPAQTTSTSAETSSKSKKIQSKDEHIQGHPVKKTSNRKGILRSNKRKILSNNESQRNQITDVNTSNAKAKKRCLEKNAVASSNLTKGSKLQAASSKNARTIRPRKSSLRRNIQQKQLVNDVDDEFDIFAKNIAFQLRQLPYYNALQCQDKIKRIINQERFIAQEFHQEEFEMIIIKKEPGLDEEVLSHPLSGPGTIETKIKEEPALMEDEYPHPVSGRETNQRIINQEPAIRNDEVSRQVSGQKTNQNKEPTIMENEFSNTVLSQETRLNEEPALSDDVLSRSVSGQEPIQTIIYHIPTPLDLIKTENLLSDTESVTSSIE